MATVLSLGFVAPPFATPEAPVEPTTWALPANQAKPTEEQVERRIFVSRMVKKYRKYGLDRDLATLVYRIAKEEGVAPALAFQVVAVESQFHTRAVSPVGARGLAQLMPGTARVIRPGTKVSELFDPELNLRLGFTHLRDLMKYYDGRTNLALTAYNRGPGNVDKALKAGLSPYNGYHQLVMKN